MKRSHKNLPDTDDEMDNVPLKYIASGDEKYRSIKDLRRYSVHGCDFCEKRFENSYDFLIHNAKHIIIPLIKMLPYYCDECGLYFIAEEQLNDHMTHVHKAFGTPEVRDNDECNSMLLDRCNFIMEAVIKEEHNQDEKPIKYLIGKRKENNVDSNNVSENILQNFVLNCKVDIEKFEPPCLFKSDKRDDQSTNVVNTHENKNHVAELGPSMELNNLIESNVVNFRKNIVKFNSSAEKSEEIKNNIINLENPVVKTESLSDLDDDPIVILAPVKKEMEAECQHFDDLIKPGIFHCKRCYKRFPNRYEVLVHEIVHMDLSKAAPESYKVIYNKQATNPTSLTSRNASKSVTTCKRCHEKVSDSTLHEKICFRWNCSACGKGFNSRTSLDFHQDKCKGEFVVNMCDTCLYLRERPKHVRHYNIVRYTGLDVKLVCHWCAKLCEDVSLVTLMSRQRFSDRIKFESDFGHSHVSVPNLEAVKKIDKQVVQRNKTEVGSGRGSKILSNREKLKLIQNRLKLMKK